MLGFVGGITRFTISPARGRASDKPAAVICSIAAGTESGFPKRYCTVFNWDDLRYFLAVHRAGTLAQAGADLQINATTVGRRLTALEENIGARLFDRTSDGYILTDAGSRLLPKAERMELEVLALERDVVGDDQRLEGRVKLTATEMLTTRFIAPHLYRFSEKYPNIDLDLITTREHISLSRREADVLLRLARPREEELIIKKLAPIDLGLYASKRYADRHGLPDQPNQSLRGHRAILFADVRAFIRENQWLQERLDGGIVALRSNSVSAVYSAAVGGVGITLLPRIVADRDSRLVRVPGSGAPEPRAIWQAVHPDLRNTARIKAVLDFLASILTPGPSNGA